MREIKFRAWDKLDKRMVYLETFGQIPYNWKDVWNLMQYTGLHDKNGREIYDGDVVRRKYGEKDTGVVEWTGHGFWIVEPSKTRIMPSEETMEVIGNIYENPELLS